ncbi:hypothetical protein [Nocardioides sp. cx-173]|uniref:hypothetical protein n=1 Tax=Nocardioides sp. cx-173 TaxID=2898796 RepID=UPI001E343FB2|nr:hypothetical protein [Nocardioides sp. cx-173]MCD4526954.1 hypothetical protein [Nocardioides sp. cx-173]UGB41258.1 hypothetical protein LQ940_18045 [Nocardioides sp. cx-173]
MAKAKFDISTLELPPVAAKPLYAGVGATDLAVAIVRDYVADVQNRISGYQKTVTGLDFEPKALRDQALTAVSSRVEALSKDAKARRAAVEARVEALQADALTLPAKVQSAVNENVSTVTGTYADLAKRGEKLVTRVRNQESTKATVSTAKTTTAKAKTTKTQGAKATKSTAKKASTTAKKTATTAKKSSGPARSSAKATTTAAKKTATNAAKAATDAAQKVGD